MHMTEKEYKSLLGKSQAPSRKEKKPSKAAKKTPSSTYADLIKTAPVEVRYVPGSFFSATFLGAKVFSLNELLRLDLRLISGYRTAMHEAARMSLLAATAPSPRPVSFCRPVSVTLSRVGKKLVDNDGLAASFKFLIDGYKEAGLITDDNPKCVAEIKLEQDVGDYKIGIRFSLMPEAQEK